MNKYFMIALAALSIAAVGCNDTAAGMKEDAKENSQKADEAKGDLQQKSEEVGKDIQEGSKDLAAAAILTPAIKTAIVGSPILNDQGNKINVDSDDEEVRLEGVVQTVAMKTEAEKIAREVMKDNKAHQVLKNNLKVAK
jgi:osmotically-inducible protein OsmY